MTRLSALVARFVRDAGRGVVVTARLLSKAGQRPAGTESSTWRQWLYPFYVGILALMPLIGAAGGEWNLGLALLVSLLLGLVSMGMLGRLARRYDQRPLDSEAEQSGERS